MNLAPCQRGFSIVSISVSEKKVPRHRLLLSCSHIDVSVSGSLLNLMSAPA